ncbi:MAG: GNAT family N-acetyltransferase [Planctomycetota bacterium]
MDKVIVRRFKPGDLNQLLDCWEKSSRLAHPFLSDEFIAEERRNIPEIYMPPAETWVTELDATVTGFIALIENEIGGLFVDPSLHRSGLGTQLLRKAIELRGDLEVDVFELNPIGRKFYEKHGFEYVSESVFERTGDKVLRMMRSNATG